MTTDRQIVIADAYDFLTAVDSNTPVEAARYWQDGPEANAAEARDNDWTLKGDWSEVWDEALDRIAERFHEDAPRIVVRSKQAGVPCADVAAATLEQCVAYLKIVDNDEGWVDGEIVGRPGQAIYIA